MGSGCPSGQPSRLGSGLVQRLRMNLSLQPGGEGTAAQPWVPESLRTSLRTLSRGRAPGENAEAPGKHLGEGPGQRPCEYDSKHRAASDQGCLRTEVSAEQPGDAGVECCAQRGGVPHSHGQPGALASQSEEGSLGPVGLISPFLDPPAPPHHGLPCPGPRSAQTPS